MKRTLVIPVLAALAGALGGCVVLQPVRSDGPLHLGPDRGILLVDTDTDWHIKRLGIGTQYALKDFQIGRRVRLYVAPAGRYGWWELHGFDERGRQESYYLQLLPPFLTGSGGRRDLSFQVRSGTISYPGQLRVRDAGTGWLSVRSVNRSSTVLEILEREFPVLFGLFPIEYTGFTRDDFPPFYRERRLERIQAGPGREPGAGRVPPP